MSVQMCTLIDVEFDWFTVVQARIRVILGLNAAVVHEHVFLVVQSLQFKVIQLSVNNKIKNSKLFFG